MAELRCLAISDLRTDQIVLYWNEYTETVCKVGKILPDGWVYLLEAPGMMYQEFLTNWRSTPSGIYECPQKERRKAQRQNRFGERRGHHKQVRMVEDRIVEKGPGQA